MPDRSRWRKLIKEDDQDGCEWVCFFWYWLTRVVLDKISPKSHKMVVVCVCVCVVCLGSSLPLGSEYVSLETWDGRARRLLTLKISRRRLGGQPAVGIPNRIDRCTLLVHRGAVYRSTGVVCVLLCVLI